MTGRQAIIGLYSNKIIFLSIKLIIFFLFINIYVIFVICERPFYYLISVRVCSTSYLNNKSN